MPVIPVHVVRFWGQLGSHVFPGEPGRCVAIGAVSTCVAVSLWCIRWRYTIAAEGTGVPFDIVVFFLSYVLWL